MDNMTTRKKQLDPLIATVRKLRKALGDTQPQFAERLGLSMPTVVRYEHNRRPRGKALVTLEQTAAANGLDEFASVFRNALTDELGAPANIRTPHIQVKNDDERDLVDALLYVIRLATCEEYSKTATAVRRVLKPIVEQQRRSRETDEALDAQRRAMAGLLKKGRSAEEVLKLFKATPDAVAEAFFARGMGSMDAKTYDKKMCEVVDLLLKDGWSIHDMAERFGSGSADGFIGCASTLGAHSALRDYDEWMEEENG
jgi:transcriptional regulator with XRE-family HTH domain